MYNTVSYTLDEVLIDFGNSVDARDYQAAVQLLDGLEFTPESEAMWLKLGSRAVPGMAARLAMGLRGAIPADCTARVRWTCLAEHSFFLARSSAIVRVRGSRSLR